MERFFSEKSQPKKDDSSSSTEATNTVPKGVVLGKDGKPCRTCTPFADWLAMTKAQNPSSSSSSRSSSSSTTTDSSSPPSTSPSSSSTTSTTSPSPSSTTSTSSSPSSTTSTSSSPSLPPSCPPDISLLGNHSWTLLHSISASYPVVASAAQQGEMRQFLSLFAKLYPCWVCGDDFRDWMARKENAPRVGGREGLGRWMCEAHNEVNRKTGKKEFDCGKWEERWRTGGEGCG